MTQHEMSLEWDAHSARALEQVLSDHAGSTGFPEGLSLQLEQPAKRSPLAPMRLETAVLVAVITASAAVLTSVVGFLIAVLRDRKEDRRTTLEIKLGDGTTLTIPSGADEAEVRRLLGTVLSVKDVVGIVMRSLDRASTEGQRDE